MIRLDKMTRSLQANLAGAVAANQPQCVVCFYDIPRQSKEDFSEYQGAMQETNTNDGTDVTICAAPPVNGTIRNIDFVSVYNKDTAAVIVTVKVDNSTTESILKKQELSPGQTLHYEDGAGWQVV